MKRIAAVFFGLALAASAAFGQLAQTGGGKATAGGGGGGAVTLIQTKDAVTGPTTSHTITFDTTVTTGCTAIVSFVSAVSVSSVATTGAGGSIGAADAAVDISSFGETFQAWSYPNTPSGVTGFTITTGSSTYLNIFAFEVCNLNASTPFDAYGVLTAGFTSTPQVSVTTTANNGFMLALYSTGTWSADDTGWAHIRSGGEMIQYSSSALGSAGSKTAGMTLTSGTGSRALGVAYKP
ncbi:MAG: hypothetical protein RLZZ182_540 [Pseudomonadota bacterium]|jgi:hypothetical protein